MSLVPAQQAAGEQHRLPDDVAAVARQLLLALEDPALALEGRGRPAHALRHLPDERANQPAHLRIEGQVDPVDQMRRIARVARGALPDRRRRRDALRRGRVEPAREGGQRGVPLGRMDEQVLVRIQHPAV